MSSFAKPSGIAFRVVGHGLRSPTRRDRIDNFAGLAASIDALGQLAAAITAAARGRLRLWRHRLADRNELKLYAEEIVRDTTCSRYDVALELRKPFWRA